MHRQYEHFKESLPNKLLSDTEAALLYLKENFPRTEIRFPPVHFLHQVYAILKNKTKVDKEVNILQTAGKVIFYKLGGDKDDISEIVVFTDDIQKHILQCTESKVVQKYVNEILPQIRSVYVDSAYLISTFSLTEANIRELVQKNILVIRDVGSYWLSFPRVGEFVKSYNYGRREILRMINKSKYSEILESELRKRKLGKKATLGMAYHVADIIGSDAVKCIHTTSGMLLRIHERIALLGVMTLIFCEARCIWNRNELSLRGMK